MDRRKPAGKHQEATGQDPFMVASIVNAFITDRNPIQVLVGDVAHMLNVVANLGKNRKLAQSRIEQLQQQVAKVEKNIASVNPKEAGNRLDKLR
ncbi:MAG: hypothetical protein K0Q50_1114 [Vampirovibrio sp.]|jgi:hypothetical protein|nr:hypothetical protein [Vampirovibrio sp.]